MRGNAGPIALVIVLLCSCGDIVKTVDGGTDDGSTPDMPRIDAAPGVLAITEMTPDWGSLAGGTNVRIRGSGFTNANLTVMFGTAAATVTVVDDTELMVVTGAGPHAPVDLVVSAGGNTVTFPTKFRNLAPLYGADCRSVTQRNLYQINPANGAATTLGALGMGVTGLALSSSGVLYGVATGPLRLVVINPYTAGTTLVGNMTDAGNLAVGAHDIAFQGDRLIGWFKNTMVEINTTTARVTRFPAQLSAQGAGLARIGPSTFAFTPQTANMNLYTLDTTTGVATAGPVMSGPAQSANAMTHVGTRMLVSVSVFTNQIPTARLFALDATTGAMQVLGDLPAGIDAIEGIPEQPPIAATAPPFDVQVATEVAADAALVDMPAPSPQHVVVSGIDTEVATVLQRGVDHELDGQVRRVVSLRSLAGGARTAVLTSGAQTKRIAIEDGLALVPNQRGELKLVDTRVGGKRLFGPITAVRFAR